MAVQIIAEAGVNHNGDIQTAQKLIEVAAQAGADIVKFQTFQAEKLVSKKAKKAEYQIENTSDSQEDTQLKMLKKLELSKEGHYQLMEYCQKQNIQFLSTGFDLESLDFLQEINIPFFKIPSGEITNLPYLKKIASFGKETILSTGMANLGEIEQALNILTKNGIPLFKITVLHCNTEYPTPMQDVNLKAMQAIQHAFGVKVGYSDHTMGIEVAIAAVALGATVIEKHFTLDKNANGPDHKASLEPEELKQMVISIRNIEKALGNGIKKPSESESKNIEIARKSVHLAKNLPAGHILTEQDFIMKRPANGISPMLLEQLIGRTLIKSQEEDYQLQWTDII
ncbi:MAG: N-acetylneuraminate synthase [Raineya sp.]|jgi:N-acetylneuraminate synthase|nr:N-acetylneuraminate synthase [Raineya sp.]